MVQGGNLETQPGFSQRKGQKKTCCTKTNQTAFGMLLFGYHSYRSVDWRWFLYNSCNEEQHSTLPCLNLQLTPRRQLPFFFFFFKKMASRNWSKTNYWMSSTVALRLLLLCWHVITYLRIRLYHSNLYKTVVIYTTQLSGIGNLLLEINALEVCHPSLGEFAWWYGLCKRNMSVISSYPCTALQILSSSLLCCSFYIHGRVLALEKASPEARDSVQLWCRV